MKISALTTDFYELTMIQGYFKKNINSPVVFDMFYRTNPYNGGYCIFTGIQELIDKLENFSFSSSDIKYLKSLKTFDNEFLDYLKDFKFTGTIYSVKEGNVVFANEPLIRIHTSLIEAQLIETIVLNTINFQTLIATKASRIKIAAKDSSVLEFGIRRAQGDGHFSATRAAYIGGCDATSNTVAGKKYNIPVSGTMAHSWIMSFEKEIDAFREFANLYPDNASFLLDTYDTLKSGLVNAIIVGKELKEKGKNFSVRLDSGDISYLSKKIRKALDENGLNDAKIVASNDLNENIIYQLKADNVPIDIWGVGTSLSTGGSQAALNGVYKLCEKDGIPTMKISNSAGKTTNPGIKDIYRFFDENDEAIADYICLTDEKTPTNDKDYTFYHPYIDEDYFIIHKNKKIKIEKLLIKTMENGKRIYKRESLEEIKKYSETQLARFHKSYKRQIYPHVYKISHSKKLKELKRKLIVEYKNRWDN